MMSVRSLDEFYFHFWSVTYNNLSTTSRIESISEKEKMFPTLRKTAIAVSCLYTVSAFAGKRNFLNTRVFYNMVYHYL